MLLASWLFINKMYWVFFGWRANLLILKNVHMRCSCSLTKLKSSTRFLPDAKSVVSSANKRANNLEAKGRSLIYRRKRRGPRIEPCGTPSITSVSKLFLPCKETNCFLSDKYDLNQSNSLPRMPYFSSFDKRIVWSQQSKAFFKSQNIARECSFLFIALERKLVK